MSRALGDFVVFMATDASQRAPLRLRDVRIWPQIGGLTQTPVFAEYRGLFAAYSGEVQSLGANADAEIATRGGLGLAREPEAGGELAAPATVARAALSAWENNVNWQPTQLKGRYAFVTWDLAGRRITAFADAFRTQSIFFAKLPTGVIVASDLRLVLAAMEGSASVHIDAKAIYHYLNFAYIPSPTSAIKGVEKLRPGFRLDTTPDSMSTSRVFDAEYREDLSGDHTTRASELRSEIVQTVVGYRPAHNAKWGTFLSGGTDSSSISGMLASAAKEHAVDSFSIGFAEAGYDEMAYSRIAAKHYGLNPHELNVDEAMAVSAIPGLVSAFDEPFGNSSAIPTFYCAKLARSEGKELLIAGDGGDEIFGGNERYAKDQIYGWYHRAPKVVQLMGRSFSATLSMSNAHIANRVKNMIHRGAMPNPDRFYSDDSFASDHFAEFLSDAFRAQVDTDDSLQVQRDIFRDAPTKSELHRLMYLDLKLTIAESDVVKVVRSTRLAGVDVAFPYLDRHLVDYAGRLPDHFKVNGLKKRYLFKLAMEDILPIEIRKKKKQGFGLPVAVWLRRGGQMRDLMGDVVLSERALSRGLFKREFIHKLFDEHQRGSWDYSSEMFRLLMLELWHREYIDARN
jgi:asparagine synthase (glutamine-hydrolysing)